MERRALGVRPAAVSFFRIISVANAPRASRPRVPALSPQAGSGGGGLVLVGRFGAAVGLRGEIRVQSFTQDPMAIADYGALTDATGARVFKIDRLRAGGKGALVAQVAGVHDRAAAEALVNLDFYADRARMPAAEEDEFYISDLVGMAAVSPAGDIIGDIVDVPNYGAGDILEVKPVGGGETLLFAFTKAVVPEIDAKARRVVVAAPIEVSGENEPAKEGFTRGSGG